VIRSRVAVLASALAVALSHLSGAHAVEPPLFSDAVVMSACLNTSPPVPLIGPRVGAFYGPVSCDPPLNVLPTVCTIVPDADVPPAVEGPFDCMAGLSFNGTYNNVMCGTFTAAGTANLPEADETYTITFLILFIANQGILVGNAPADDGWDVFTGPVTLVQTAPLVPPCPVTQYRFTTALTAVDSPVPIPLN
jgi:hypothetical protein